MPRAASWLAALCSFCGQSSLEFSSFLTSRSSDLSEATAASSTKSIKRFDATDRFATAARSPSTCASRTKRATVCGPSSLTRAVEHTRPDPRWDGSSCTSSMRRTLAGTTSPIHRMRLSRTSFPSALSSAPFSWGSLLCSSCSTACCGISGRTTGRAAARAQRSAAASTT
eukprot:Amastigsp_a347221_11.p3 type:complete len:170 gc:universal Amastigsp_a347221_11:779-270(-)